MVNMRVPDVFEAPSVLVTNHVQFAGALGSATVVNECEVLPAVFATANVSCTYSNPPHVTLSIVTAELAEHGYPQLSCDHSNVTLLPSFT
jgi:hypothetical protein